MGNHRTTPEDFRELIGDHVDSPEFWPAVLAARQAHEAYVDAAVELGRCCQLLRDLTSNLSVACFRSLLEQAVGVSGREGTMLATTWKIMGGIHHYQKSRQQRPSLCHWDTRLWRFLPTSTLQELQSAIRVTLRKDSLHIRYFRSHLRRHTSKHRYGTYGTATPRTHGRLQMYEAEPLTPEVDVIMEPLDD